jgi:hypothetical protein
MGGLVASGFYIEAALADPKLAMGTFFVSVMQFDHCLLAHMTLSFVPSRLYEIVTLIR